MRTIKFRGRTFYGEWVYGNYAHIKKDFSTVKAGHYISNSIGSPFAFLVRPETVGQFTGLKDKNGKDIYEGDFLKFTTCRKYGFSEDGIELILHPVQFGEFNPENDVLFDFIGFHINNRSIKFYLRYGCEVVGNKYENPELLKNENKTS